MWFSNLLNATFLWIPKDSCDLLWKKCVCDGFTCASLAGSPSSSLTAWMNPLVCCGHITYTFPCFSPPASPLIPPETCLHCGPLNCADSWSMSGVLSGRCGCGLRIRAFKTSLDGSAHHFMVSAAYVFTERA